MDTEILIDLREWLEVTDRESLPGTIATDYAFTAGLWSFVETVPFPEIGPTAVEDRILLIHRAVLRSLYWALSPSLRLPPAPGGMISFVAKVRSRCCESAWSLFRLHIERACSGSVFLTVGLGSELKAHPLSLDVACPEL